MGYTIKNINQSVDVESGEVTHITIKVQESINNDYKVNFKRRNGRFHPTLRKNTSNMAVEVGGKVITIIEVACRRVSKLGYDVSRPWDADQLYTDWIPEELQYE